MAIQIRLLQQTEIGLANNFFNSIYKVNRPIKNFQWEFLEGPCGKAIYVIAVDDSVAQLTKIVGIQCAIPIELTNAKGDVQLTAKSEDTLVDPAYRGQKIFERMYDLLFEECKKAGVKYIWGFTPAKKAFERIGFEIPFQSHQALMVFKPTQAYSYLSKLNPQNRFADKLKIAGLALLSWMTAFRKSEVALKNIVVKNISIQTKVDLMKASFHDSTLYYLHMTEEYMAWRITKNPFNNFYENYQFYNGTLLIADVMVNFRQPDLGYFEQIIFASETTAELKKIVIRYIADLMRKKVSVIRVFCFDTNPELQYQKKLLQECGFIVLKRGSYFVWKALGSEYLNPNNLFLTRLFTQGNQ